MYIRIKPQISSFITLSPQQVSIFIPLIYALPIFHHRCNIHRPNIRMGFVNIDRKTTSATISGQFQATRTIDLWG